MKKYQTISGIIFCLLCISSFIFISNLFSQTAITSQINEIVASVEGLSDVEQSTLLAELNNQFENAGVTEIDLTLVEDIKAIINAGLFEEAPLNLIADVAFKTYSAEKNGASGEYVRELALIGFSRTITISQLEAAARDIEKLLNANVDPGVTEDFISYGLYNGWDGAIIDEAANGLIQGIGLGLQDQRLALYLIISIDQDMATKNGSTIVDEAIQYLSDLKMQAPEEAQRQQTAYNYYQNALQQGLNKTVAEEIYFTAIEDKWSQDAIEEVYKGLVHGQQKGLTTEKLATSIIIRMAQADNKESPAKIVQEEIEYIGKIEKKRSQVIQDDEKKYVRSVPPTDPSRMSYIQPKPTPTQPEKQVTYYNAANRPSLNQQLMWQSIQEFLGPPSTPYRWGGTSRSGIDCSGFVQKVYLDQGIYLPRVSAQQYQVGRHVMEQLRYGDLLFFSKYGPAYQVTHVGIYLGGDRFVHSSASKGVTISSLNEKYYRLRFKGAKRMIY